MMMMKLSINMIFTVILVLWGANAFAETRQDDRVKLRNIIITNSEKPSDYFADQPYSANVLVLEELEQHGIRSVQDIAVEIPNFNYMEFGARSFHSVLGVRGLTNTAFYSDPSVVFYVDDVPYGNAFSYSNKTYSIERIEAYRGPQGQMFGKNSYGGVFNVTSRQPENKIKGHISAEGGRFNRWSTDGFISGGLIKDKLFFSLGGSYGQGDGYLRNTFLDNTPDDEEHLSGRASLVWKPSDPWDISLIVSADQFDDETPRFVSLDSDPFEIQSNQNGQLKQVSNTEALRIQYQKDNIRLLSVTARRDWRANPIFLDADFTPAPITSLSIDQRQTQWSQEFRLSSNNQDMNWLTGLYVSTGKYDQQYLLRFFDSPLLSNGQIKDNSYAIFANSTYNLNNKYRFNAGLRVDYVKKRLDRRHHFPNGQVVPLKRSRNDFFISPKIGLDYLLNDHILFYASTSLAFKPGGFSFVAIEPGLEEFDNEKLWANEVGFKSNWLDNRAQLNLAFFYYKIKDYQVEKLLSLLDYSITNAPRTTSYGIEVEAKAELLKGLQLETAFGYNHIRFDRYQDPVTSGDFSGNTPPHVPEYTLMLAAQYKHPQGYFARTEWLWTGKTYFDDANSTEFERGDYSTLKARLGFESKYFDIFLFGENLTDKKYFTFKLPGFNAGSPARPRTLGIKISLDF